MTLDEAEKIKSVVENKKYIEQLVETVSKTLVEAFENIQIKDVDMFKLGYNKAIDDFYENIIEAYRKMKGIPDVEKATLNTIALGIREKLKEGGSNE